ncbi:MAG: hypothetical protein PHH37_12185 [Paludibacter sp.]|nr:hypothetical protein [Paludibacter sp.]
MKAKKKNKELAMMKIVRAANRKDEIKTFGKPINYNKVVISKKVYNRKKRKTDHSDDLSFSLS